MDCKEFNENIIGYVEDRMDGVLREQVEEHMGDCSTCYDVYRRRFDANKDLSEVLEARNIGLSSRRLEIMKRLDNRRYSRSILNRLVFHFKIYNVRYAACALSILLVFVSARFLLNGNINSLVGRVLQNNLSEIPDRTVEGPQGAREQALKEIIDSKLEAIINAREVERAMLSSSDQFAFNKAVRNNEDFKFIVAQKENALNYLLSRFEKGEEGRYDRVMAMACAEILGQDSGMMLESGAEWYENYLAGVKEIGEDKKNDQQKESIHQIEIASGNKQEINPTGDGISNVVTGARRKELSEMLKKLKADGPGVGLWKTTYIGEDRIIFYNYSYLMAYNSTEKNKGIYSIIDYSKLNVGSIQGSLIAKFIASPNGQYCLIGNSIGERDIEPKANLYLFDLISNTSRVLGEKVNLQNYLTAWSSSSQYLVVADKTGNSVAVHDVKSGKVEMIPFNHKTMKRVFVSDKGNVLISGEGTYLFEKGNYSNPVIWNIEGDIVNYDHKGVVYYNQGNINLNQFTYTRPNLLKTMDKKYKFKYLSNGLALFTDGSKIVAYNFSGNALTTFNPPRDLETLISPDGKRMITSYMLPLKLINSEGDQTVLNINSEIGEYYWKNSNTLIAVIHCRTQEDKPWELKIIEVNVDTLKGEVVFQP